jgi:hypothetical protein
MIRDGRTGSKFNIELKERSVCRCGLYVGGALFVGERGSRIGLRRVELVQRCSVVA